jgi:hypothetical protein
LSTIKLRPKATTEHARTGCSGVQFAGPDPPDRLVVQVVQADGNVVPAPLRVLLGAEAGAQLGFATLGDMVQAVNTPATPILRPERSTHPAIVRRSTDNDIPN